MGSHAAPITDFDDAFSGANDAFPAGVQDPKPDPLFPGHFPLGLSLMPRLLVPNTFPEFRYRCNELSALESLICGLPILPSEETVDGLGGMLNQPSERRMFPVNFF